MDAKIRRRVEMGRRVLIFCQDHPTMSAGYARSVARLEYLVHRAEQLFGQQMDGRTRVRAAAERKVELRRGMKLAHIPHLAAAAQVQDSPVSASVHVVSCGGSHNRSPGAGPAGAARGKRDGAGGARGLQQI